MDEDKFFMPENGAVVKIIDLNGAGLQGAEPAARREVDDLAVRILSVEADNVANAPEGSRNDQLNRSAFALGQLVAGGVLSESMALGALEQAADDAGMDGHEVRSTIRSGIESGKMDPRTIKDHDGATRTPEEIEADRVARERRKAEGEARIQQDRARAETWAARFIELAGSVQGHAYIDAKQIEPCQAMGVIHADTVAAELEGFRIKGKKGELEGELLAFPLQRIGAEKFCSAQFIDGQGRKAFLPGKRTTCGAFWTSAALPAQDAENLTFLFGEGVATVLSAEQAVDRGVPVAVMSDHNAEAVAKDFRRFYPRARFIFLADIYKETGLPNESFSKAAQTCNGFLAVPDFGPGRTADQTDFNDLARVRGAGAVRECVERAQTATASRFEVLDRDSLMGLPPVGYVIKNVMPDRGMGAVFAPSMAGKSFAILDMAAHIAEGLAWFGYRVRKHPVGILVLEGAGGVPNRIRAWEKFHERRYPSGVKFLPPPRGGFDLRSDKDVADLITSLQGSLGQGTVLFIDTLAQALPGAEENGSKDYSLAASLAGRIERTLEGFVCLVGHTGKDAAKGLRGHSSLFAALDMALEVMGVPGEAGRGAWILRKSKDGEGGVEKHFKRVIIDLGVDADGDPVTSCAIEPVECSTEGSCAPKAMSKADAERITAFRECAMIWGTLDADGHFIGLDPAAWKQVFINGLHEELGPDSKSKAFRRCVNGLKKSGWITDTLDGFLMPSGYGAHVQISTIEGALQERARTKPGHF